MSELLVKSESLTALADSIRTKTGNTEPMVFPDGFVEAVEGMPAGGNSPEAELALTLWKERITNGRWSFAFSGCKSLTEVPLFDAATDIDISGMFHNCESITTVPLFDTSFVEIMDQMFFGCHSLIEVPLFNTSAVESMGSMFCDCESLATIPMFDTKNVRGMGAMFYQCTSLKTIPMLDTRKVENMALMFDGCTSLTTIPALDMRAIAYGSSLMKMLKGCTSLTDCWLCNIKFSLDVSDSILLTLDSLIHLIRELIQTNSKQTLTVGTTNLAKLANVYVRTISITDEMRAEDDLIDEKLPFVVCESTDEGAMLITDYVLEKNWQLK